MHMILESVEVAYGNQLFLQHSTLISKEYDNGPLGK